MQKVQGRAAVLQEALLSV